MLHRGVSLLAPHYRYIYICIAPRCFYVIGVGTAVALTKPHTRVPELKHATTLTKPHTRVFALHLGVLCHWRRGRSRWKGACARQLRADLCVNLGRLDLHRLLHPHLHTCTPTRMYNHTTHTHTYTHTHTHSKPFKWIRWYPHCATTCPVQH